MNFASPGLVRGVLWDVVEAAWGCLGLFRVVERLLWAGLQPSVSVSALSWAVLERLGAVWGRPGAVWGRLGVL